jgi:hypothetical protein
VSDISPGLMAKEPIEVTVAREMLRTHGYRLRHTKNGWFLLCDPGDRTYDPSPIGPWTFKKVCECIDQMQREGW